MVRRPNMLVIDPSIAWPEDDGVREIVRDWPGGHTVLRPALRPGDGPAPGFGYDFGAVVVMGSRASVSDDRPWLRDLAAWLRPILDGTHVRPLLGICFGHQLLAHCAGARVGRVHADRSEERGVKQTVFVPCRLVPAGGLQRVVASHGEIIETQPAGFRTVARREHVAADALEHEHHPIFSVQFHPEARADFLSVRGIPACVHDAAAFEDQARLLARFRELAAGWR